MATDFAAKLAQIKANKGKGTTSSAPPTMSPPALEPATDEGTPDSPSPTQRVNESDATDVSVAGSAPPWASPGCMACTGIGFNTAGSPCKICIHKSGVQPDQYNIEPNDDGTVTWCHKEDTDQCGVSPLANMAKPAKSTEKDAATEGVEVDAGSVTIKDNVHVIPTAEDDARDVTVEEVPLRTKKKRTRKSKTTIGDGFTLCINCGPIFTNGSADEVVHLCDLLVKLAEQMASDNDVESFYDINNFDRRDALRKHGKEIAADLIGKIVVCELVGTGESDTKALLDAIRPHASVVLTPNVV